MLTFLGTVCIISSIVFTYAAIDILVVGRATFFWVRTTGIVESNSIRSAGVNSENECHTVDIAYRYNAMGEEFVGREIGWRQGRKFSMLSSAQEVSVRYPVSVNVNVFYDPSKPQRAVLVQGRSLAAGMVALTGAIAFLLASYHFLIGFR